MRGCPQDPIHHAEGDVWVHTWMVCEALVSTESWRQLSEGAREILFWAALLHDVAKPDCTRRQAFGRVTSRGHVRRGAIMARRLLWETGMPFADREHVVQLVRYHSLPFWLIERADHARTLVLASQNVRCDWLALLAEADARGRHCEDLDKLLENIELFAELGREQACLHGPREFASRHTRFLYAHGKWPHCDVSPHEDFGSEVVLMSGFPGVGKDHWIRENLPGWPVVSLDAIRRRLGISPKDQQGKVVQEGRAEARRHLRDGMPFVWNATNLSHSIREQCVGLFADYRARIRIVYLEVPPDQLRRQNRERPDAVPDRVIDRLTARWEVPDPYEGHQVDWIA